MYNSTNPYNFYNEDCILAAPKYIKDNSIDLIITDPPYGIKGDKLHQHYNRNHDLVIKGYIEVPINEYSEFSKNWIEQAERILKPGGSIYIVSGYTNLNDILNALKMSSLTEINHIIWKYNFGVYTKNKYISSHYHILFYEKPGRKRTFNQYSRFGPNEKDENNGSLNYQDREDVWMIKKEYKPGRPKNINELPSALLKKMILYSSFEGDIVCDMFLGGFSTAIVAKGLKRLACGFEKNDLTFEHGLHNYQETKFGELIKTLRQPELIEFQNQGKSWDENEKQKLIRRYKELKSENVTKSKIIEIIGKELGRGPFAIINKISEIYKNS
jgi:site-specific DNA-methyltransferase (adenine-specific)